MSPLYEVQLHASGTAVVEVEAVDAEQAALVAIRETPGMIVEGGECSWDVDGVEEIDPT